MIKQKMLLTYNNSYLSLFSQEGLTCMIEPINDSVTIPGYYLTDVHKGKWYQYLPYVPSSYKTVLTNILITYCSSSNRAVISDTIAFIGNPSQVM